MKKIEVEVLNEQPNSFVIQFPQRKYPSLVLQGDSMWILYQNSQEALKMCQTKDVNEATETLAELVTILRAYVQVYENTLAQHQIALPYNRGHNSSNDD